MANRNEDVVTKPAQEAATNLERAVRTNDKQGYDNAMSEVNKYRDTHTPDENKAYTAAITKRLEDDKVLPTVSLFEVQRDFKKIDTSENGRLERGELDNFANRRDVNDLQRNLIGNVQQNYNKIRDISKWGETWYGGNSSAISDQDINDGVKEQQAQMNLYAPDKAGKSLVEKLVDKDGNIPHGTIKDLLALEKKHPGQYLSPEDKRTLEDIESKRTWLSTVPFTDDVKKADLAKMATQSATNQKELENQPRNSRVETPVAPSERTTPVAPSERTTPVAPSERTTSHQKEMVREGQKDQEKERQEAARKEQMQKDRDAKILDALTIHGKNHSYAHAAEKLLALAGNTDPTAKQLRDLQHQLWVADGRRKAGALAVGDHLKVDDAIKHNQALAKLFAAVE